jgi:hypothetical protein
MASLNASITSTGLISSGDASGVLALQTNGADALIVNANANVTVSNSLFVSGNGVQPLVSGTSQNTTSGTSIDFTSIPSWVRRITVMFNGVSTNGASSGLVQLGTSSGITTSGYLGAGGFYVNASSSGVTNATTGICFGLGDALRVIHGHVIFTLLGSNTWVASGAFGYSNAAGAGSCGGSVTLSGTLTQLRITTVNGTDTFDAGSVNILYE